MKIAPWKKNMKDRCFLIKNRSYMDTPVGENDIKYRWRSLGSRNKHGEIMTIRVQVWVIQLSKIPVNVGWFDGESSQQFTLTETNIT